MTNKEILADYRCELKCAHKQLQKCKSAAERARLSEYIDNLEISIQDLEGLVAMDVDSPTGGLAGWLSVL